MNLAQYGITFPIIVFFICIGVVIGKLWYKTISEVAHPDSLIFHQIEHSFSIILLFILSLVTAYLLVGLILVCFIYATITSGLLGEWTIELFLTLVHLTSRSFHKPLQPLNVHTNLHTLPEALKE